MTRETFRKMFPWIAMVLAAISAGVSNSTYAAAAAKRVTGPAVNMRWGPVKVTLVVKGKKVVNVLATAPMDRARSVFINDQALPLLKREVLQAQSASVNVVSGATLTSRAYITSLQKALVKAHL